MSKPSTAHGVFVDSIKRVKKTVLTPTDLARLFRDAVSEGATVVVALDDDEFELKPLDDNFTVTRRPKAQGERSSAHQP